jgi:hypothetical protein
MGFEITSGSGSVLDALLIVIAISAAIPVLIWFVALVRRARADVVEDSGHDLEA